MNIPTTIALLLTSCRADVEVTKTGDSVVDAEALTIYGGQHSAINGQAFQQDALKTFQGYQYVTWYDKKRQVCLGRRRLPDGKWEIIRFSDYIFGAGDPNYRAHDAHNTISMGICPADGTIHLAFDHHMHTMNYRVSSKGAATNPDKIKWTPELFGPVHSILDNGPLAGRLNPHGLVTYPRFIVTPDDKLQLFYRAGDRRPPEVRVIHNYDPDTGKWSGPRPIIADNGYTNYHTRYGKDGLLHLMFHWRGSKSTRSGCLCYLYTDDLGESWKDNDGKILLAAGDGKFISSTEVEDVTVVTAKEATHIMLGGQYMDSKSRPHQIVWHIPDHVEPVEHEDERAVWGRQESSYHHYWRDEQGSWHSNLLPSPVGNRAKIFLDADDNAYAIFMVNQTDEWKFNIYFKKGDLVIATASAKSKWSDWKLIHREPGPFLNQALFDDTRWETDGVLSVIAQNSSDSDYTFAPPDIPNRRGGGFHEDLTIKRLTQPTPLRILDFKLDRK